MVEDDFGLPDMSTLQPEQRAAMELVEKIATKKATEMVKAEMEKLNPKLKSLEESSTEQRAEKINVLLDQMKDKYKESFEEVRPIMGEMLSHMNFPQGIGFKEMEQLYAAAMQKSGKLGELGKELYEKDLAEKQRKSVDNPLAGSPGTNGSVKVETIIDAFKAAKLQHGMKQI